MRILIDGLIFQYPWGRGVQRCFYELLSRIGQSQTVEVFLTAAAQAPLPRGCQVNLLPPGYQPRRRHLCGRLVRHVAMSRLRQRVPTFELFHSTYFSVPPDPHIKQVVTVYDMIFESFPDLFYEAGADTHVSQKRELMEAATIILAISQATADDIAAFYPHLKDRVRTVHLGADHLADHSDAADDMHRSEKSVGDYALFVGDRALYKNFRCVLAAMVHKPWPAEMSLMVIGKPFTECERMYIQRLGLERHIVHRGFVADAVLQQAYRQAVCLVLPALCEGFGFPLLEAQSCGCPVVCNDIPVFRELGAESVIRFDARLPEALAAAVGRVLAPATRQQILKLQKQNFRRFTWDECARKTLLAYGEAIGQ